MKTSDNLKKPNKNLAERRFRKVCKEDLRNATKNRETVAAPLLQTERKSLQGSRQASIIR